jgi:hypothetical protein
MISSRRFDVAGTPPIAQSSGGTWATRPRTRDRVTPRTSQRASVSSASSRCRCSTGRPSRTAATK